MSAKKNTYFIIRKNYGTHMIPIGSMRCMRSYYDERNFKKYSLPYLFYRVLNTRPVA